MWNEQEPQSHCDVSLPKGCRIDWSNLQQMIFTNFWLERKLSVETLWQEFTPNALGNDEFYRQKIISIAFFGLSWKFCSLCKNQVSSIRRPLYRQQFVSLNLDGRNQANRSGEIRTRISGYIKINISIWNIRNSTQGSKSTISPFINPQV